MSKLDQKLSSMCQGKNRLLAAIEILQGFASKKKQLPSLVLQASDVVKSHLFLIERLKQGSQEEKQMALSALETIKQYNFALASQNKGLIAKIGNFFSGNQKSIDDRSIDPTIFSKPLSLESRLSALPVSELSESKITNAFASSVINPSNSCCQTLLTPSEQESLFKQEVDVIKVKASTLLKELGPLFSSDGERINSLKEARIENNLDSESLVSTLCLTLDLFPGSQIKISGSFKRSKAKKQPSIPLKDTFQMAIFSKQAGFPFPFQHTGFALGNALIPIYPHRLSKLPLFHVLYEKKNRAASALQANGALVQKAKDLFCKKKSLFSENEETFLNLHHLLFFSITKQPLSSDFFSSTADFASFYEKIRIDLIEKPFENLYEAWINGNHPFFFTSDKNQRTAGAKSFLEEQQEESDLDPALKNLLGPSFNQILLQHFSESLEAPPLALTDLAKRLQLAAYRQLDAFLNELASDFSKEILYERMIRSLKDDISLFSMPFKEISDPLLLVIEEIEYYYLTRWEEESAANLKCSNKNARPRFF